MKFIVAVLLVLITGCSGPIFKEPIGREVKNDRHLRHLEGIWTMVPSSSTDRSLQIRISKVPNSVYEYQAEVVTRPAGDFEEKIFRGIVREAQNNAYFASLDLEESAREGFSYLVFRFKVSDSMLVLWASAGREYRDTLIEGKLQGYVWKDEGTTVFSSDEIRIESSNGEMVDFFRDNGEARYFDWENPYVLVKENPTSPVR